MKNEQPPCKWVTRPHRHGYNSKGWWIVHQHMVKPLEATLYLMGCSLPVKRQARRTAEVYSRYALSGVELKYLMTPEGEVIFTRRTDGKVKGYLNVDLYAQLLLFKS